MQIPINYSIDLPFSALKYALANSPISNRQFCHFLAPADVKWSREPDS